MAKYIGRQINVWFGLEWTRGTAVGVQNWQPKTDMSFKDMNETIQDESSIWVIVDSRDSFVVKKWAEWDINGNVEANWIWYLFYALLWSISSEEATTGAYTHTFTLNNVNQGKTLTIWTSEPNSMDYEFALWSIESMTLSAEEWQQATFSVNFKAKKGEATTHTVNYDVDNKLLSRHSIFKTAENLAWLWDASSVCLKSFEITMTRNLEDDFCLWSDEPTDFLNQQFVIEWSFSLLFENNTFKDYVFDGTHRAVRFELSDTNTTIWESSNPTLRIDLPLASMTEWDKTQGNDEVVSQTITFKGLYSDTDSSAINVALTNTVEEYVDWTSS